MNETRPPLSVLVADDSPVARKLVAQTLPADEYTILPARTGKEALELFIRTRPEMVITDWVMPDLTGIELCAQIRAVCKESYAYIILLTTLSGTDQLLEALHAGADDFLTKPVNDTALFARVRSLVRLRRMTEEWRHREEVYDQFNALFVKEAPVEDRGPARILLWEENAFTGARIAEMLAPVASETVRPSSPEELLANCDQTIELVILSLAGKIDALRLVSQLRANESSRVVPILLMADPNELPRLAKGLDLGATDYLVRPLDRNELIARARTSIRRKRLQDRLQENYQKSLSLALTDGLTGLYNRRYLSAHLESLLPHVAEGAKGPALLMFDIDFFKRVNDSYGHAAGDAVLREVSARVSRNVRAFDLVSRYGGEEFVVVLPETPLAVAVVVAERLRSTIAEQPILIGDPAIGLNISISVGVSVTRGADETAASLMRRADEALYAAKAHGRNCVMTFPADAVTADGAAA